MRALLAFARHPVVRRHRRRAAPAWQAGGGDAGGLHGDAGLRAGRHAVAGPHAGRQDRRRALDRSRQDLLRAGRRDARTDEPRLGARCAGAHRRRSQGRPGRHLRDLPGPQLQRPRLLCALERQGRDLQQAAADHRRHDQPALRDGGGRSLDGPRLRGLARQAQRSPRRAPPGSPIPVRHSPMPGRTARRASARPPSRSTIPANAAASASPSPVPAGRPWCSATSSPARSATTASSPSRTRRRPGPVRRVSADEWKIEACPHHGPSIAILPDGSYHVAWFTDGSARKGLFYARADNGDTPFGAPRALSHARPPAGAALSSGQRQRAPSRVEGVRRHQGRWCAGR